MLNSPVEIPVISILFPGALQSSRSATEYLTDRSHKDKVLHYFKPLRHGIVYYVGTDNGTMVFKVDLLQLGRRGLFTTRTEGKTQGEMYLPKRKGICGNVCICLPKLIGSGTIRRCDFVVVGMTLLEEVCHCGGGI